MEQLGWKHRSLIGILSFFMLLLGAQLPWAAAGPLRIVMADGTSLEVPFCWEEQGQIKFETAGGIVGIPKAGVTSIQEIITAGEFDPEVMLQSATGSQDQQKDELIKNLLASKGGSRQGEKLSPEEAARLFGSQGQLGTSKEKNIKIHAANFRRQADFSELVRAQGDGVVMVMKYILTTHENLRNKRFTLTLYDAQGNAIQRKACDIYDLMADKKTLRKIGMSGTLFSVVASYKPDPKIKRYEIVASQE